MDLVGIDVGFEVAKSFAELSFGEPRWRPSPIQARMVAAGRLGRKTGRGYYEYAEDGPYRPRSGPPAPAAATARRSTIARRGPGGGPPARARAQRPATSCARAGPPSWSSTPADPRRLAARRRAAARAVRSEQPRRARRARRRRLRPAAAARLARGADARPGTQAFAAEAAEAFFARLGFHAEWVEDAPGLVLGPDRLPARERGLVRGRRGRRLRGRRGRRAGARPRPPARADRVGRGDRPRARDGRAGRALGRAPRGALPARPLLVAARNFRPPAG